jgi:protocatechuate 3,4-dioxygenase beta subunit
MKTPSPDASPVGSLLARREVLALFATSAGAAVLAAALPDRVSGAATVNRSPTTGASDVSAAARAATPSCVVRPAQTEGPYFVDERLERADIRADPSDGSITPGAPLTLTFAVARIDGSTCEAFPGVLVDVWHCNAAGVYSDAQDPGFDTRGQKFLRGYRITDAGGTASFVTIYPGWYQGRTVHIHFKLRTDPALATGLEFTSQLYFDDALTDVVHAQPPYAAKGERTLRNDGDGIYRDGGAQLLLAASSDGAGGYVATLEIGVEAAGSCATVAACLAALRSALPTAAGATDRREKRTALRLQNRIARVAVALDRAAAGSGRKQSRRYTKARSGLQALLLASQTAAGRGTLGVALTPIEDGVAALLAQFPS